MKPSSIYTLLAIASCLPIGIILFIAASCESGQPSTQPCDTVARIYIVPNYDSALAHYAKYSNLISDTAIYRADLREKLSMIDELMEENGKLRFRLGKAATDIARLEEQMKYSIYIGDTTKRK